MRVLGLVLAETATEQRAGVDVDDPAENDRQRDAHFGAPDGKLYELVEDR